MDYKYGTDDIKKLERQLEKLKKMSALGLAMLDLYNTLDEKSEAILKELEPDFIWNINKLYIKPLDAIDKLKHYNF